MSRSYAEVHNNTRWAGDSGWQLSYILPNVTPEFLAAISHKFLKRGHGQCLLSDFRHRCPASQGKQLAGHSSFSLNIPNIIVKSRGVRVSVYVWTAYIDFDTVGF